MNDMTTHNPDPAKGRRVVLIIFFLFLIPVLLSYGLYYFGWQPPTKGKASKGILVSPVVELATETILETFDHTPFNLNQLKGKWTLLTVAEGDCLAECQQNLYYIRQVRTALERDLDRVQRVFLAKNPASLSELEKLKTEYAGTNWLSGEETLLLPLLNLLATSANHTLNNIYVIDPLGNLMMYYPPDVNPKGILEDLKRLLKLSKIG